MLNLNSAVVFSEDPKKLSDFYKKVFEKDPDWSEGNCFGFAVGQGFFTTCSHDKVHGKSANPERIMLNFETKDVAGEFERVKKLGALVVAEPYGSSEDPKAKMATLADPDGNYFQLVTPWDMGK